jgi:hypothetical protein
MKKSQLYWISMFLVLSGVSLMAQPGPDSTSIWKKEAVGTLNYTLNQFDNWAQGGENSWNWQLNLNAKASRTFTKFNWTSSGKILFGQSRIGDADSRKSSDEIRLESIGTYKSGIFADPYLAVTALSQLAPGYQYQTTDTGRIEISNFLDPGFFTQSLGLSYAPNENFAVRLGAALKETVTRNHPIPYSDDPATTEQETFKFEYGTEVVIGTTQKLSKTLLITSKLGLFSNLKAFNTTDLNWDNSISASLSKYLVLNFNLLIFYDRDIAVKRQIKQMLMVGLTYTFI